MDAAILCIGTELTRGEIDNTNATWLSERLTSLGTDVRAVDAVADDAPRVVAAFQRLSAMHDLVVSTGGLGPTTDDITNECVAAALGVRLRRDEPSLEAIRTRMARFGRTMSPSNEKQADVPAGATILANDWGTAPGYVVPFGRARIFVLPGVPREMKPMFDMHVVPFVERHRVAGMAQVRLRTFGLPESTVNDRLAGLEARHGVTLGYRAHFPEVEVKVLARAVTDALAHEQARTAADAVRTALGDAVFAQGGTSFAETVGQALRERSLSLATAESCTGGLVGAMLTDAPGASDFFRGGVVAYDDRVKTTLLGVDVNALTQHGAVSEIVARQMAEGARRALSVDLALSLTGIAGPGGGTEDKPVGLVHFAVATADGTSARQISYPADRELVRRRAAFAGLSLVRDVVLRGHERA